MADPNRKFRVVKYARVSTEEQANEDRFSIDAQISEMDEYIARMGWEPVGQFVDRGISGTKRYRPQLNAMLAMAERGGFDIVLVHELSRLSRSVFDTLDMFQVFGRLNIGFSSVKDPDFDFSDPTKRFFLVIISAINEYYINLLKLHTSKSKRQRAKQGLYNASITPYGYQFCGDPRTPPVIVEKEAEAVKKAFAAYSTGRYSYQDIANMLTDSGYLPRPRRKKGEGKVTTANRFSKDTITDMMHNPFYIGKLAYRVKHGKYEEIYDGAHPALITQETWDRCQKITESRRVASRAVANDYRVYLLSNIARCDVCDRKLRSQWQHNGVAYYREMSLQRGYDDCPHQKNGVRAEVVDPQIAAIIKSIQLPEDWQEALTERLKNYGDFDQIGRQRGRLEAERLRLKRMRLAGDFDEDVEMYNSELVRIRRELDALPTSDQLESLKASAALVASMGETWDSAEPEDQRDLVRLMFREIRIDVTTGRVVALVPQAVMMPILREVKLLEERELGVFVPVWNQAEHAKLMTIPQVPPVMELPELPPALPFLACAPYNREGGARIAPSVSQALAYYRRTERDPEMVVQIRCKDREDIPFDLRKWPMATGVDLSLKDFLNRPEDSIDVLISQFPLWDQTLASGVIGLDELMKLAHQKLSPGGVWYFVDIAPLDMPAHWVFRYFPKAWEWCKAHTWDTHQIYSHLQGAGFSVELKRKTSYQPVSLAAAVQIAGHPKGMLNTILQDETEDGLAALRNKQLGRDHRVTIPSETTVLEVWAQKPF